MKRPDNWTKNELLRAERLNEMIEFSAGNHFLGGAGIAGHTGTRIGKGLTPSEQNYLLLVQATEDFAIQTTNLGVPDDVPSGGIRLVRLNMRDSVHETSLAEDRAYDPITGLQGGEAPVQGDYFYVMFNRDSGRWEKIGAAQFGIVHGIPRQCLNDGWYYVELATFNAEPQQASDFENLGEDCGTCGQFAPVSGSDMTDEIDECNSVTEVDRNLTKPTGLGIFAFAHDCDGIPLKIDGHVKMVVRGPGVLGSSGSVSYSGSDPQNILYDILSGTRMMIKFPAKEVWTCCPDGSVILTSCTSAIVYGIACDPVTQSCPAVVP